MNQKEEDGAEVQQLLKMPLLRPNPPTATIQPTTNTASARPTAQKAPVPAIATRTRAKTDNTTTPSTSAPTTTKAPKAPRASSMITKGQNKVLHNNPGTTGSAPSLPPTSKATKKKRPKTIGKKSMDSADTDDSDPDTVKKPAKKKVQRYHGPNSSTARRLPMYQKGQSQAYPTIPPEMTEEEYKQAIKSSSNRVLYDLLARKDRDIQELTVRQHKVKLLTWQVGTLLRLYFAICTVVNILFFMHQFLIHLFHFSLNQVLLRYSL